jgi:hypothetical protein
MVGAIERGGARPFPPGKPQLKKVGEQIVSTFTDGYGGDVNTAKDARIRGSADTLNYGISESFYIYPDSNYKYLLQFDLSSIPSGSSCTSATLHFYRSEAGESTSRTINLYAIASGNAGWVAGTKAGDTAAAGECCYAALAANGSGGVTTAWAGSAGLSTADTDFESSAVGSFSSTGNSANGTDYAISLTTTRIAQWFGVSNTNYGLLVVGGGTGWYDYHIFGTAENPTTGYRPKLVIEYTSGATVTLPVFLNLQRQFRQ